LDNETLFQMSSDSLEDLKPKSEVFDLSGKVAVVTGTVGLALFVINRLAECGAKVVFGGRTEEWGKMAETTLKDKGYALSYLKTDVRKVDECYALTEFAEKTYGTVDIVVPAAATWGARAFVDMKEEEWDDVIDTGLKGQYFTVQAAVRSMIRGGKGGKVVTIASVAHRGDDMLKIAMMTNYNAAKAGVVGMTKGIAKELKQYGINVNCVAPGGMLTPGAMMNNLKSSALYGAEWDNDVRTYGVSTPLSTTPDEVALMIVALCTDISNFMYGQLIEVDGGSQFSFQAKPWSYTLEGGKHA
jgi:NAD(P)-dependent dehydrogenase (short-subunit alcohol dehydrogenase family)